MTALAISDRRLTPMAVGAALFLLSDLLLAVWIFHDWVFRPFDLVWLSYGPGQMLIVYGAIVMLRILDAGVAAGSLARKTGQAEIAGGPLGT